MNIKNLSPNKLSLTLSVLLIIPGVFTSSVLAMPANPNAFNEQQPDGTEITLRIKGDEHFHYTEDQQGYTVVHKNGWYNYARLNAKGQLVSTSHRVGHVNPADVGLSKHILPPPAVRAQSALTLPSKSIESGSGSSSSSSTAQGAAPAGTIKNLVVMVRFSDHTTRTLPTSIDMNVLFNGPAGPGTVAPTGSIKDVYLENSYGQMTLDSSISGWIDVNNTESYYANGQSGLTSKTWEALKDALSQLDQTVDFSQYDADGDGYIDSITFIHSGYAAEWGQTDVYGAVQANRIWSHRWAIQPAWISNEGIKVFDYHISPGVWGTSGSNIGRIGVISHETGHFFGLPDLYDTDSGAGDGIGSYGMMANSWGFDSSQLYPPHFSAWSKIKLGWSTPTVISADGEYSLNQAESSAEIYRIDQNFPAGEYLLIENRQSTGFDAAMPQGGLAIWHIDDNTGYNTQGYPEQTGWPTNGNHYRVALLQADGNYNLEKGNNRGDSGDVFHANGVDSLDPGEFGLFPNTDAYQSGTIIDTGHSIFSISASAPTMSFCLGSCSSLASPGNLAANTISTSEINLNWKDNSAEEDNFLLERSLDGSSWSQITSLAANITSYADTGLNTATAYYYRVQASNTTQNSGYSNITTATTLDVIPTSPSGISATATSSSEISLVWTDNAHNENGYRIEGRPENQTNWVIISNLAANSISYTDTGLSDSTTYYYRVYAYNDIGDSSAAQTNATTDALPAFIDYVATAETFLSGTVSGNYLATQNDDDSIQSTTEEDSGGRPANRYDYLEHRWTFNINAGSIVSLFANAWVTNGSEDSFNIEYSSDGSNYTAAFTVSSNSADNVQSAILAGVNGTVYIRVKDTDSTRGNRNHQTLNIDHLYIRSENAVGGTVPDAPSNLSTTADSSSQISISWLDNSNNESGFTIARSLDGSSWSEVTPAAPLNATSYIDSGLNSETRYYYRVKAFNATGDSSYSNSHSATTSAAAAISLSANAYKVKGKHNVDLSWSGAITSTVDIWRDGIKIDTVNNSGSYSDNTGANGGATYVYKLCEVESNDCSDDVTVYF